MRSLFLYILKEASEAEDILSIAAMLSLETCPGFEAIFKSLIIGNIVYWLVDILFMFRRFDIPKVRRVIQLSPYNMTIVNVIHWRNFRNIEPSDYDRRTGIIIDWSRSAAIIVEDIRNEWAVRTISQTLQRINAICSLLSQSFVCRFDWSRDQWCEIWISKYCIVFILVRVQIAVLATLHEIFFTFWSGNTVQFQALGDDYCITQ